MKEFQGKKLDRFQEESINHLDKGNSVVVSAATGTGKTLIADYVIDKYLETGKRIVYTAPIKALSNQKFSDFKKQYGEDKVGILTGDVTINPDAPLRIMTTEIYRNMLLSRDPEVENIAYVIFDEIHYIGDIERGTVWEESLIFSHENTRFLCLSATIPNAKQLANWISFIKKHPVDVVTEKKRAVPLHLSFYDTLHGFNSIQELKGLKKRERKSKKNMPRHARKRYFKEMTDRRNNSHIFLLDGLKSKGNLPAIYFCFSRALTQKKAITSIRKNDFLTLEESTEVKRFIREKLENSEDSVMSLESTRILRECLAKGVGFHHAGLLPIMKEIVEHLFAKGLVKVLFATETFAVGINMPAKTVCFDSMEKFDGINFRYLNSKEFFQLAGRAGRRGIDKEGFVVSVVESEMNDLDRIEYITSDDKDQLTSQFKLSYNTILNLIHNHSKEEQQVILNSNFYAYQQTGRTGNKKIINSFMKRKKHLKNEDYIDESYGDEELTNKGLFAMKIYTEELLVTELFHDQKGLTEFELLLLAGRVVYEEKKNVKFEIKTRRVSNDLFNKFRGNKRLYNYFRENPLYVLETFLKKWYDGCEFVELLEYTSMPEGDIVRFIRQILDLLQQIQHATLDSDMGDKIADLKNKLDRDVISVRF